MTAAPAPRTWVTGEVVTAAEMNANVSDVLNFLLAPPILKVRQTIAQSIPNTTFTALTFDSEDIDSAGGHSTVTNTSRYTAVYPGWYELLGGATFAASAVAGYRQAVWGVNGSLILDYFTNTANITTGPTVELAARGNLVFLNVGDYVELYAWQNVGAALNTAVAQGLQSSMIVQWRSN